MSDQAVYMRAFADAWPDAERCKLTRNPLLLDFQRHE